MDAVNYQIKVDKSQGTSTKDIQYDISLLLSNNESKIFQKDFNDALLQFVTSSSLIQNASLASWTFDLINSPARDYFYIVNNGLMVLRDASDTTSKLFYDFYIGKVGNFNVWLFVQLSLLIFILFLTIFTLILTHVRLLKIYKEVTIFYGYLTLEEVQSLRTNVETFQNKYLKNVEDIDSEEEDNQANQQGGADALDDDEKRQKTLKNESIGVKQRNEKVLDEGEEDQLIHKSMLEREMEEEDEEVEEQIARDERREKEQKQKEKETKKKESMKDRERDSKLAELAAVEGGGTTIRMQPGLSPEELLALQRSTILKEKMDHLIKKRTIYLKIPYCNIVFNGLLLVSLFTITVYQSFTYISQLNWIIPLHRALSQRTPNIQYLNDLARDTILQNNYRKYKGIQLFDKYMNDVENLEDTIATFTKLSYPPNFGDFSSVYLDFSLQNLCDSYLTRTGNNLLPSQYQNCLIQNNPILSKGEAVSMISTINYARELVMSYRRNPVPATLTATLRSSSMRIITAMADALNKTITLELETFESNWQKTNNVYFNTSVPLYIGLIIYLLLSLFLYLMNTLGKFSRGVMYNKGLLNLIPQNIILNNRGLKERITLNELKNILE